MKRLEDELSRTLDVYEQLLSTQAYLAGDGISLADLFVSVTDPYDP
jgi:glutathione S-transferase